MKHKNVCCRRITIYNCACCNDMKRDVELDNGKPSVCPNYLGPSPPPFVTMSKLLKALSQFRLEMSCLHEKYCTSHTHPHRVISSGA